MPTIFDSVVTNENDHTNLLRNIMERYPKVAAAILSHLLLQEVSETRAASFNFRTQHSFPTPNGREIPDILIDGDGFRCLIEAKIDPALGLTDAQKKGYAACFSGDGEEHLFFLVPSDWRHREDAPDKSVATWRELISKIERVSESLNDDVLNEAVNFWKWRFELESMTAQEKEALSSWYNAIRKLQKTIIQAKGLFDARNFETERETPSDAKSYGFYLKRAGSYLLWIGMWEKSSTPLTFGFDFTAKDWIRPAAIPSGSSLVGGYHLWPMGSETWDDPEKFYEKINLFLESCKAE